MKKLFTACLITVAVIFFGSGILSMINTGRDPSWMLTDGVVLGGELETHFIETIDNQKAGNMYYAAAIIYNFTVNNQTYTGKCIVGNTRRNDPSTAQKNLDSYPEGKIIRILYNPNDPEKSAIDTYSNKKAYLRFLYGLLFLGLSVLPSIYVEILASNYPSSFREKQEPDIESTIETDVAPKSIEVDEEVDLPENIIELAGFWELEYQIPSLREIISAGQNSRSTQSVDRNAVMETGFESLSMMITGNILEMNYKDIKQQGGCCIISKFKLEGNRLTLVHKSMDFMIADVEGFPPTSYTYIRKGSKLSLMSNEIAGLGKRRITYHFTLSVPK